MDEPTPEDAVGWVVLTSQPDGSWQPDWDGILHTEFTAAVVELAIAGRGWPEGARLVECREVDWEAHRVPPVPVQEED